MNRNNPNDSQYGSQKRSRPHNSTRNNTNAQLLPPRKSMKKAVMFNTDTVGNTAGTYMTTTTAGQPMGPNHSSNSSTTSRSSNETTYTSMTSPIILYKINLQANANARRTVLLLILLLSFYVLCWAPYNIFAWHHIYKTAGNSNETEPFLHRSLAIDFNVTDLSMMESTRSSLQRFIYIHHSLYLLSMMSMCFSFIFYFSLNKQARHEFSYFIDCLCPRCTRRLSDEQKRQKTQILGENIRRLHYDVRYQHYFAQNNPNLFVQPNGNQRVKTMRFNTHPVIIPPASTLLDRNKATMRSNSLNPRRKNATPQRASHPYGHCVERRS
ncbi:unnamed protein product [Adineta ricciae]|uniref:Uncharacterized protein n=1 Tax=Adineta ricciae TaxID=249248 RepID=A0A813PNJ3_ADIRI|nr:unnamed protein product [Adineta ricciae]CAF1084745.1 unnamed protein product [Adineta ricciae]